MNKVTFSLLCSGILYLPASTGTIVRDTKIRELPSMEGKVVATRKKGRVLEILEKIESKTQGTWYKTPKGYIYEKFIILHPQPNKNTSLSQNSSKESLETQVTTFLNDVKTPQIIPTTEQKSLSPVMLLPPLPSLVETPPPIKNVVPIQQESNTTNELPKIQEKSSVKTTKEIILNDYTQALNDFKNKNYQASYTLLNELFNKNLNDININFYLGRSAFELALFDEAVLAYERILFEKPETLRVQFELGRTYLAKENYLDAKKYFLSITEDTKAPKDLVELSQKYLLLIEDKISKYKIGGILMLGVNYDSNINNSSKYDFFDYPLLGQVQNTTKKEGAFAHQEVAVLNYSYQFDDKYLFKTDGLAFLKSMFDNDLNDKNIKMIGLSPSIRHTYQENLSFDYGVFIDNVWVGGDNYIQSYGINPKLNYTLQQNETLMFLFKYQIKNYQQQVNKPKDSTYTELAGTYTTLYNENWIVSPTLKLTDEKKQAGTQQDVDNKAIEIALNNTYLYSQKLFFLPSFLMKKTTYDTRDEKEYLLKIGANYLYTPQWIIQGDASYTTQTATQKAFEYNKYNFGVNLIRSF